MYVPRHFARGPEEIRSLVRDVHVGQLVTVGADGTPEASLCRSWEGEEVVVHMARANEHWRRIVEGLVVVTGPDATSRLAGMRRSASTAGWCRRGTTRRGPPDGSGHRARRPAVAAPGGDATDRPPRGASTNGDQWQVGDAPERFVTGQLRAIVGVSMTVTGVEAKAVEPEPVGRGPGRRRRRPGRFSRPRRGRRARRDGPPPTGSLKPAWAKDAQLALLVGQV